MTIKSDFSNKLMEGCHPIIYMQLSNLLDGFQSLLYITYSNL